MKYTTLLIALLVSVQAGADCAKIDWEPPGFDGAGTPDAPLVANPPAGFEAERRRQAYLDCLEPGPLPVEQVQIELPGQLDALPPVSDGYLKNRDAVAVN